MTNSSMGERDISVLMSRLNSYIRSIVEYAIFAGMAQMMPDMAAMQVEAIKKALEDVIPSLEKYSDVLVKNAGAHDIVGIGVAHESQSDLIAKLKALTRNVQGPVPTLFTNIENVSICSYGSRHLTDMVIDNGRKMAYTGAIRTLLEMGGF